MRPLAAIREFIRMARAAGPGLEQAGRDIRDHPAPRDWAAEAFDRNTAARQANTDALNRLTDRMP